MKLPGFFDGHISRYLITGGCVTVGGTLLLTLLLQVMPATPAFTITFILSVAANAVLQSRFVFRRTLRGRWPAVLAAQLAQYAFGLASLHAVLQVLMVPRAWAPAVNLVICTPVNFLISRAAFRPRDGEDAEPGAR